ncbi:MAG TPA: serine/threonine-protein kinase [Polyangiaceae bacterium]|nr:serine/threonine-protein kinase [Polyangiaceae bacterium]
MQERYRSLFVIGRGGMGTVEVALERGARGFERVVALKRLLPEGACDPRHKEMFLREARLAALLAHPNVVHAFAFGEIYGQLFMAMEYVEGEPLSQVLEAARQSGRALPAPVVAHVLAQVCDGLHAAHELRDRGGQGRPLHVVHRDVSPHNVMISYEGRVKLLDFGVAKFEAAGNETRTGEVKGKMAYMSPEQALGEKLDRRSDLFSVGAVLFECLTGERMWGSGTDLEVMRRLALERPPRLDAAMPGAPRALVDLHARLVAHDPANRPQTARQVAQELAAFAASSRPGPGPDGVGEIMLRLFGARAQSKRALLTESLEQVDPARVNELRRSLEPSTSLGWPTSTEALILEATPRATSPRRSSRRGWLVATFPLLALAGAAAEVVIATAPPDPASSTAAGAPAAPMPAAAPALNPAPPLATAPGVRPVPPSVPAVTPPAMRASAAGGPATVIAAPDATGQTAPQGASPAVVGAAAGTTPAPSSTPRPRSPAAASAAPKLPDVDPTPF